jgi:1-acyl-sn-glycerol-3-phosphate acyltransferase
VASHRVPPLQPRSLLEECEYSAVQGTSRLVLRTLYRASRADTRELPEGPVLLAANHRSFLDPLVVGSMVDRRVTFMMHAKYYDLPALNWFFRMARCIVVEDESDNRATLRQAKAALEQGRVVGIFPEGHISSDGSLQPLQPGMAWLARRTGAPVVPMWVGGTREALTKGSARLRLSHVRVAMGEALDPGSFPPGRGGEAALTEAVTAELKRLEAGARR